MTGITFGSPDTDFIVSTFTHPDVWPHITDDSSDGPEEFGVIESPLVHYLAPTLGDTRLGCLMLIQVNAATLELHTALLPDYRGHFTKAVFDALCDHLRATFPHITRLRTWVAACNRPAYVAAKRVGFDHVGTEPSAYRKGGAVHDLHLFGVTL